MPATSSSLKTITWCDNLIARRSCAWEEFSTLVWRRWSPRTDEQFLRMDCVKVSVGARTEGGDERGAEPEVVGQRDVYVGSLSAQPAASSKLCSGWDAISVSCIWGEKRKNFQISIYTLYVFFFQGWIPEQQITALSLISSQIHSAWAEAADMSWYSSENRFKHLSHSRCLWLDSPNTWNYLTHKQPEERRWYITCHETNSRLSHGLHLPITIKQKQTPIETESIIRYNNKTFFLWKNTSLKIQKNIYFSSHPVQSVHTDSSCVIWQGFICGGETIRNVHEKSSNSSVWKQRHRYLT